MWSSNSPQTSSYNTCFTTFLISSYGLSVDLIKPFLSLHYGEIVREVDFIPKEGVVRIHNHHIVEYTVPKGCKYIILVPDFSEKSAQEALETIKGIDADKYDCAVFSVSGTDISGFNKTDFPLFGKEISNVFEVYDFLSGCRDKNGFIKSTDKPYDDIKNVVKHVLYDDVCGEFEDHIEPLELYFDPPTTVKHALACLSRLKVLEHGTKAYTLNHRYIENVKVNKRGKLILECGS